MRSLFFLLFVAQALFLQAQAPCEITSLTVQTGNCSSDSTYMAEVHFTVQNPNANTVLVYGNGVLLGQYPVTQTTIVFSNFAYNGGANDVIKICVGDNGNCCRIVEFPVPACLHQPASCLVELTVDAGPCTSDSSYQLTVHTGFQNPTVAYYDVWINGVFYQSFPISQTSFTANAQWNGGPNDVIKVCVHDHPNCCKTVEYPVPDCLGNAPCQVNFTVDTGDCTGDSTYNLSVFTNITNPGNGFYEVWLNGTYFQMFPVSQTNFTIPNAQWNGGNYDAIKICVNDRPDCCKVVEYLVPTCLGQVGPCLIDGLSIDFQECVNDSIWVVEINFTAINPGNAFFNLLANGQNLGTFPLSQLPLTLNNFQTFGNSGYIKVCINDQPNCCRILEFDNPDCPGTDCEIYDLTATASACLCGQFFAVLSFETNQPYNHEYMVMGNGHHYGTYTYSQNPILLGPLPGNGQTPFEFVVKDKMHPDCKDVAILGVVDCDTMLATQPIQNKVPDLSLSPNPAKDQLTVRSKLAAQDHQAVLEISNSVGQIMITKEVNRQTSITVDVSTLSDGIYMATLKWAGGSATANFVKVHE